MAFTGPEKKTYHDESGQGFFTGSKQLE